MITVAEIKKKAERIYPEVLKCGLTGEVYFPKIIRANKILSRDFAKMSQEIAHVMADSKDRKGFGYIIISETVNTRHHGIQDIPKDIIFETLIDYLKFIGKVKEYEQFIESCHHIQNSIPQLNSWLIRNSLLVISNTGKWKDLLKVCDWFLHRFEPNKFYIRELPIAVHTKFIEENKGVLRSLLDELIPEKLNAQVFDFEKRFYLKYSQPIIRFRILDVNVGTMIQYNDIGVPLDQFMNAPVNCEKVIIIENQMNFLTFPKTRNAIAIWGKGFAIENFKQVSWLNEKEIYYWSDLDAQGFQMLSQLRAYFPQTTSILMNKEVLELHKEFAVVGTPCRIGRLNYLSVEEYDLFDFLLANTIRLEQERIPQQFINDKVDILFNK